MLEEIEEMIGVFQKNKANKNNYLQLSSSRLILILELFWPSQHSMKKDEETTDNPMRRWMFSTRTYTNKNMYSGKKMPKTTPNPNVQTFATSYGNCQAPGFTCVSKLTSFPLGGRPKRFVGKKGRGGFCRRAVMRLGYFS